MMIGLAEVLLILLVGIVVVIPYWKIFGKAGFPSSFSLLMVMPLVNVAMLYYLAFASWPSLKKEQE